MQVIDLFSGIGGFSLAGRWAGWNTIQFVEIDKYCQMVLKKHWPNVPIHSDIKTFGPETLQNYDANETTIITGGFPCQGFSVAGQRKGKSDDRYLWPEMLRVINEIKPAYIVGENVTGIIGLALDTVLSDLENSGYTTEAYIIPACGKNAWHRRDRVWIVAYANSIGRQDEQKENGQPLCNGNGNDTIEKQGREQQQCRTGKSSSVFSNTESKLSNERENGNDKEQGKIQLQTGGSNSVSTNTYNTGCEEQWEPITDGTELFAPKCSSWWEAEPGLGRVVTRLPHRVDRLKGLGNAVVPQVVYEIFMAINKHNETHAKR